jgi:signal transduction histidine kinase
MSSHEIKPKQLRALLLLLVLVPLIPTVLMIRFVIDAVQNERAAEQEKLASVYRQTFFNANASLARHLATRTTPITPREVHQFYRDLLDREVVVRVTDSSEKPLTAWSIPRGTPLAQTALKDLGLPFLVQIYLLDDSTLVGGIKEHLKAYAWTVILAIVAIFSIAGAAGVTVSRQLALHELKSTSVATVAHELRTPLASMRMLVDTLREGRYRDEVQFREYLDLIAGESLRLSRLTDNFLTLSRLERKQHAFAPEPIAPRALAEQAVQAMRPKLEASGVHFTLRAASALPEMHVDRDAMVTVLTNLLENALKYTEAKKEISLNLRHDRGQVIFSVQDNGIGLSRTERRHVFEPFYQSDEKLSRAREGCGLGLSIVKHIVGAHGGQITVTSEPGKGSSFHVMIPAPSNRLT